jgi:hypothetical protein
MKIQLEVPDYSVENGMEIQWEPNFTILAHIENESVNIKANSDGLISLARILLTLAQSEIPSGYHIHLDSSNSLEDGSCELVIEKM